MKSLAQWFDEYGESHQNKTNKAIHYICVPLIFLSIVGLLMTIPNGLLVAILGPHQPILENWATVLLVLLLVFYLRLSVVLALLMLLFSGICLVLNYVIGQHISLGFFSLSVFVVAWIGQFYGHKLEGKKPSFLKDLQFLLIGPAWVVANVFKFFN
jgi:uncharacterized membrane protein YGL010W